MASALEVRIIFMYNYSVLDNESLVEVKEKTIEETIAEEAQLLEQPKDSEAFLKYMMRHAEKTSRLQKRLESFSRMLMTAAVLLAFGTAFIWLQTRSVKSPKHKLSSSQHDSSTTEFSSLSSVFNGLSVVVWSMIAAKAKTGLSAASSGDSKSVSSSL